MQKNSRCKSTTRKPLANVSNGGSTVRGPLADSTNGGKPPRKCKEKTPEDEVGGALDRLLLVHTDLSKLINQIDELVVQGFKRKATSIKGNQEIESFACVLSDIHSSLKPWVPRFKQAFGSVSVEPGNQLGQSLANETSATDGEQNLVPEGTNGQELGLIVSPSPLVSWRAGSCKIESGKQLFLLTPLPKAKVASSKCPDSSKFTDRKFTAKDHPYSTLGLPQLANAPRSTWDGGETDTMEVKHPPNEFTESQIRGVDSTLISEYVSSLKTSNCKNRADIIYCLTPCLKNSKRRTCFLLDPEMSFQKNNKTIRKSTPWDSRRQKIDEVPVSDDSSSDEVSKIVASKCPELFGQQPAHKSATQKEKVDVSCLKISPPRTCFLLNQFSESFQQDNKNICKLTPWAIKTQKCNDSPVSNSSGSDEVSKTLASKYPELFGLQPAPKLGNQRKEADETLDWFLSPPKTCVLMELVDDKLLLPSGRDNELPDHELTSMSLAVPESTPMWKDLENTIQNGKKPGEMTLKRELWTKFEAVSADGLHFDASLFKQTARTKFLDMLEEVS